MRYVIWSFDHQAWWRPNRQGYTTKLAEAGRYSAEEAGQIVTDSIFLDEVAILEKLATSQGEPLYHPYRGDES